MEAARLCRTLAASGEHGMAELMLATHAEHRGFRASCDELALLRPSSEIPAPYTELAYQPMIELLVCLRANGFKTYIVT